MCCREHGAVVGMGSMRGAGRVGWLGALLFMVSVSGAAPLLAQDGGEDSSVTAGALDSLIESHDRKLAELNALLAKPERSEEELQTVTRLREDIKALEQRIVELVAGTPGSHPLEGGAEDFQLQREVSDLLEPLVRQLKEVTSEPRQIEQLRSRIGQLQVAQREWTERIAKLRGAIESAEPGSAAASMVPIYEDRIARLERERRDFQDRQQVAQVELNRRLTGRKPIMELIGSSVGDFFRTRGMNLLIALSAFLIVFVAMRFVRHRVLKVIFRKRANFYSRLLSVLLQILGVVCALAAALLALFAVSDWILLLLVFIFLVGIGWASVNMLPRFIEQIRLLLNLGPVREGERVIFDGIPWRIEELKIYTLLKNPELTGGEFRIPVADLVDYHSRPIGPSEVWFPCRQGDWVLIDDRIRARVAVQTPDLVQLVEPGGGRRTYSATEFLAMGARNLSRGYRISRAFGIDYQHQAICTTEVPTKMREQLYDELVDLVGAESIVNLSVEFADAGSSSLDYRILLDLDGSTAAKYDILSRAISRILVDVCNREGWVIPFTQITLHQA